MPPLSVYRDRLGEYHLADGWHRLYAAKNSGIESIRCTIYRGEFSDALAHACAANSQHGLRRSIEDRTVAVVRYLLELGGRDKSNRAVADACRVSHTFVSSVRSRYPGEKLEAARNALENPPRDAPDGGNEVHRAETGRSEDAQGGRSAQDNQGREEPRDRPPAPVAASAQTALRRGELGLQSRSGFRRLRTMIADFEGAVVEFVASEAPGTELLLHKNIEHAVQMIAATLKDAEPSRLCFACEGNGCVDITPCATCSGLGWISSWNVRQMKGRYAGRDRD